MRPAVSKYYQFKDLCRLHKVTLPEAGAAVTFVLPMPRSWSRIKMEQHLWRPHQQRPDLSNLIKALEDALYGDDSHIWCYAEVSKVWGYHGEICIYETGLCEGGNHVQTGRL